ncbi:MAG: hypothetical protein E7310_05420 [Clostridiales bacterium]|nr:hypothetical protein [Clostridiales bacterium]
MGHQEDAIKLFLTEDINEAKELVKKLNLYNVERQEKEKQIFNDALSKLENENIHEIKSIVLGEDGWHHGVIGIVASKLAEKFYKPTILICFEGDVGKGSGRSIQGFDLHEALVRTSDYLDKFGGHEMAIGLSLQKDALPKFKEEFNKIVSEEYVEDLIPVIKIDAQITKKDMNFSFMNELQLLEPFGEKNKTPIFVYKNLKIDSIRSLSEGKHLKLLLRDENFLINAIGFNLGELSEEYLIGDKIDVVGTLEINSYNGQESIQINIKDIMKSI